MCVYLSRNVAMFRTVKGECCLKQLVSFFSSVYFLAC